MEHKEEQLLIELTNAKGIAGNEDEVRTLFKKYAGAKPIFARALFLCSIYWYASITSNVFDA